MAGNGGVVIPINHENNDDHRLAIIVVNANNNTGTHDEFAADVRRVEDVVRALRQFNPAEGHDDRDLVNVLQFLAYDLLGGWESQCTRVVRQRFTELGGLPLVIKFCNYGTEHGFVGDTEEGRTRKERVEVMAMNCLWNYGEREAERLVLVRQGALPLVAKFLSSRSHLKQHSAAGVLWNLVEIDDVKLEVVENGCSQALIALGMKEHNHRHQTYEACAGTLQTLSSHPRCRMAMVEQGVLDFVCAILADGWARTEDAPRDVYVQFRAAMIAANASLSEACRPRVHDSGAFALMRGWMDRHSPADVAPHAQTTVLVSLDCFVQPCFSDELIVQQMGAFSVAVLSFKENNRKLLRSSHGAVRRFRPGNAGALDVTFGGKSAAAHGPLGDHHPFACNSFLEAILINATRTHREIRTLGMIALENLGAHAIRNCGSSLLWKCILYVANNLHLFEEKDGAGAMESPSREGEECPATPVNARDARKATGGDRMELEGSESTNECQSDSESDGSQSSPSSMDCASDDDDDERAAAAELQLRAWREKHQPRRRDSLDCLPIELRERIECVVDLFNKEGSRSPN